MSGTLDPRAWTAFFVPYGLLVFLVVAFLIFPLLLLTGNSTFAVYLFVSLVLGELAVFGWAKLVARSYTYNLSEKELTIKYGVLTNRQFVVPLSHIQNVRLDQDFISRRLALAQLTIQTAGDNNKAVLPGLFLSRAQTLRAILLKMQTTDSINK